MDKEEILKIIDKHENPYPKDIFLWDSKEKLNFNRGRFNEFIYNVVENMRAELKKEFIENG